MIIGLGVDVVDIPRVRRMVAEHKEHLLPKLFTLAETEYALGRADPAQHLAVRLAAKEAAFKALSGNDLARGVGWREIEVRNDSSGAPVLSLHGRARSRAEELGVERVLVTLSHTDTTAVAVVILEK